MALRLSHRRAKRLFAAWQAEKVRDAALEKRANFHWMRSIGREWSKP
ncbi:hypothetical protein UFOVP78_28 [uncultured Caudovirales phage]|uniref:Uncharacterized protein n=1 Tax=uncultured Caudovirales phage TaxID=2100421 RepID=A0A6J5L048_9CAUD|nr:hypothetical protein UFOVP78_28 [uncultured Caudovirales phage]